MIKLIVSDLDGTLLSGDHVTVSEKNKEALRYGKERGAKFAIATGRTYRLVKDILKDVKVTDYLILSNGAGFMDLETKEERGNFMDFSLLKTLEKMLEDVGAIYEVYADGKCYILDELYDDYGSKDLPADFVASIKSYLLKVDSLDELKGKKIEKINSNQVPVAQYNDLKKRLEDLPVTITSSRPGNLEISAEGADKGAALKQLAEHIGLRPEEIVVFADGPNDLTMMNYAGHSYAMENAEPVVKKAADKVTLSYKDDGVAAGLYEILKGEEHD